MLRGSTGARRERARLCCTVLYCGRANAVICSLITGSVLRLDSGSAHTAQPSTARVKTGFICETRASRCVVCGRVPCPASRYIATITHSATTATASRGAERGSRVSQAALNPHCGRVRAAKHAPRGPFRVLERRHGLAEVVERGAGVRVERLPVNLPRSSTR